MPGLRLPGVLRLGGPARPGGGDVVSLADVIALHRPTRTPGVAGPDLPPCGRTWTPRTCRGFDQRSPIDHQCWTWSGWPHICRCLRCHREAVDGQVPIGGQG
jgi:hypothetical protein